MENSKKEKLISFILNSSNKISLSDRQKLTMLIRPTVGVRTQSICDGEIQIGRSKIGGQPDLPKDFIWPRFNGTPLLFCAQYNLSEIQIFEKELTLPHRGFFYVFLNVSEKWSEFSVLDQDYKFIYSESEQLLRTDFPYDYRANGDFQSATIEYFQYFTLPAAENYRLTPFIEKNKDFYFDFYQPFEDFMQDELFPGSVSLHQILGYDRSVQASVVYDFASKELDLYTMGGPEYQKRWAEVLELSKKYEILLQIDCDDDNTNLSKFGGSGTFYFGIKHNDLKAGNFDNVCMSYQMT